MKKGLPVFFLFIFIIACNGQIIEDEILENENEVQNEEAIIHEELQVEENQSVEQIEKNVEEIEISYRINPNNWKIEPLIETDEKVVLLTVDDAPHKYAVQMARTLKNLDAGAIFFVNGHFLNKEGKEHLLEIHQMGFEIGNHTMNHPNLRELSEEEQKREIIKLNHLIETITGERPRFFRAPFGVNTDFSEKLIHEEHMISMNWTYGYDWEKDYQNKEALVEIMVHTPLLSNGANLLMHDRQWTFEALEEIVNGLRGKGFRILDPKEIES